MKQWAIATGLAAGLSLSAAATEVGVSVQVSQPGVYGRIDIGAYPRPVVLVPRPVVIVRPAVVVAPAQPVYLWVPPGHRKNWRKHCGGYAACSVPVYFVQDGWYEQNVMQGKGKGKGHGKRQDD